MEAFYVMGSATEMEKFLKENPDCKVVKPGSRMYSSMIMLAHPEILKVSTIKFEPKKEPEKIFEAPQRTIRPGNVMVEGQVDFTGMRCQEASIFSTKTYIPCGAPASCIVWHEHDGKHLYLMCDACGSHNVRNRGGRLIADSGSLNRKIP